MGKTVGNEEKAKAAKAHGCDHPIIYTREDFVGRVDTITQGQKLPVVYDSVGKDTFMKSLDCLRPRALMVSFGQSSGPVGPVDLGIFAQKGSLFFTRPTLNTYAAKRADLLAMAEDLFEVVLSGAVKIEIGQTYPLPSSAAAAQRRPRGLPPTNKQEAAERREPAPAAVAPPPPSASAEAAGERRYLTVMFCDLVGSTGIVAQLDAEEWRDLVGTYLDDASAAVRDVGRVLSDDVSASPMDRLGVVPR